MGIRLQPAQRFGIAKFRRKNNHARKRRNQAALAGNAEFGRKIRMNMGNGFQFAPPGLYVWQTGDKNVACLSIYYNSIDFNDFSKKLMRSPPFEAKGGGEKENHLYTKLRKL